MALKSKIEELERVREELEAEETLSLEKASLYGERLILLYSEIEILESKAVQSDAEKQTLEERIQLARQDLEDWKSVLTDEKATEKDKAQGYMCIQILEAEITYLRNKQSEEESCIF